MPRGAWPLDARLRGHDARPQELAVYVCSVLQFFQGGVKARRQRAGWEEAYLVNVLFHYDARALVSSLGFII